MTVDLEWLVYLGMTLRISAVLGPRQGRGQEGSGRLCASPAEPSAVARVLPLREEVSYRGISASAAKKIPVIVSSLVFLFEKSFK